MQSNGGRIENSVLAPSLSVEMAETRQQRSAREGRAHSRRLFLHGKLSTRHGILGDTVLVFPRRYSSRRDQHHSGLHTQLYHVNMGAGSNIQGTGKLIVQVYTLQARITWSH